MKKVFSRPRSLKKTHFHYCPGCGHSLLHRIIGEVIDEMDLQERVIGVPPAGCAVLAYNYFDIDMGEAAHGRAAALATGLKRALPDKIVFTYQGDGDIAAIGTAETIHAAARGENFTTIFVNNGVYGMTGGQMAPTTIVGQNTTTSPGGRKREKGWPPDKPERNAGHCQGECLYRKDGYQQPCQYLEDEEGDQQGISCSIRGIWVFTHRGFIRLPYQLENEPC